MKFYLKNSSAFSKANKDNILVLYPNNWDDWFIYSTLYNLYYYENADKMTHIGSLKIGQINMLQDQRSPDLPEFFETLGPNFFSLGQDVSYYESLNSLGEDFRDEVLRALNDIAASKKIYSIAISEKVTRISLLRSVSTESVEGQYRRLAQGNAMLTPYTFKYHAYEHPESRTGQVVLDFNVIPDSNPPTNIHVIIGRNGVGKTHMFNNMIVTLLNDNKDDSSSGYFTSSSRFSKNLFANLVSVSFSAFDETNPINEKQDKTKYLSYSYIGLKSVGNEPSPKSPSVLKDEFVKNVERCRLGAKNKRWIEALEVLETDPIFKEAEVSKIAKLGLDESFKRVAGTTFNKLSSGHKIVLLSITRLVETIEERSLVLLDEPEGYLHPPLLSAFIRALSNLLVQRNAVAIIGTHSPVVLQETPKSCVWKLRRHGFDTVAERLEIESFGENVGTLTQEVFGLEVTESGFHKILKEMASSSQSYEEAVEKLNNQLGLEARAILRNLLYT